MLIGYHHNGLHGDHADLPGPREHPGGGEGHGQQDRQERQRRAGLRGVPAGPHGRRGPPGPTYVYTYVHTYVHTYIHICIYTHMYTHVYIYIYIYTHTYADLQRLQVDDGREAGRPEATAINQRASI